jgi:uracil-DNA glycosylase
MFIGMAPSWSEFANSQKLDLCRPAWDFEKGSDAAKLLGKILTGPEFASARRAYFTNVVKCTNRANKKKGEGIQDNCYESFLKEEIERVHPTTIIALGRTVHRFLKKREHNLKPVYHPSFLVRGGYSKRTHNCITKQDYAQQLKEALGLW